ncbi:non-hydrolyzing UDP-N-acetylglucosamine 2-epimerase [Thermaurantiacus sp.]
MRVLTVLGTRPEAIKLAPVVRALEAAPGITSILCATGQHREMLDQALTCFALKPQYNLAIMRHDQTLSEATAAILDGVSAVLAAERPDWVLVQGDTTTTLAAALAAFHARVPVAHVEAGLRTGDTCTPWPEEMNRRLVTRLATLHFPPTAVAAAHLRAEGVAETAILVTGNTVIDALHALRARLDSDPVLGCALDARFGFLASSRRLLLATAHRRESLGGGLMRLCTALRLAAGRGDLEIAVPVHPNPAIAQTVHAMLAGVPHVHLLAPLDPLAFVHLLRRAHLVVTDSGGVVEEAAALGRPVLITREKTERSEAVKAGGARLVGTATGAILTAIERLLADEAAWAAMVRAPNPFGDGHAAARIVARLRSAEVPALPVREPAARSLRPATTRLRVAMPRPRR